MKDEITAFKETDSIKSRSIDDRYNNYGDTMGPRYAASQTKEEVTVSSEYFLYKKILEKDKKQDLRICNIGAFYCISEDYFLKKRPKSIIHGLDFTPFIRFNKKFEQPNLILHPGYPLDAIEKFARESNGYMFDYVIFARAATLINQNEIRSYMAPISKIAKNIAFLEVAQAILVDQRKLDIRKISLNEPYKLYGSMVIHNYPKLIESFDYKVVDAEILPPNAFNIDYGAFCYWVYVMGTKKDALGNNN